MPERKGRREKEEGGGERGERWERMKRKRGGKEGGLEASRREENS